MWYIFLYIQNFLKNAFVILPNIIKLSCKFQPGVQLPSSVFASEIEEPVGLLNKAAPIHGPRPELDPDIVAALDDDFNYDDPDNVLEDNFIELANQEK